MKIYDDDSVYRMKIKWTAATAKLGKKIKNRKKKRSIKTNLREVIENTNEEERKRIAKHEMLDDDALLNQVTNIYHRIIMRWSNAAKKQDAI